MTMDTLEGTVRAALRDRDDDYAIGATSRTLRAIAEALGQPPLPTEGEMLAAVGLTEDGPDSDAVYEVTDIRNFILARVLLARLTP